MTTRPRRLLFVLGTRPEAIKLAPLILAARQAPRFEPVVCATAQHRDMMDKVLRFFEVQPEHDLDLMRANQTLTHVTCGTLEGLDPVLQDVKPDWLLVQGDTATTFAGALAAFYRKVPVAHVEAGLRTGDVYHPWPEEMNRKLTTQVASLHLAPTRANLENLLREGVDPATAHVTGNTGIDALRLVSERLQSDAGAREQVAQMLREAGLPEVAEGRMPHVVITAHRRESFGPGFTEICLAIADLCREFPHSRFLFPVHPNPSVRSAVDTHLRHAGLPNLQLCDPLDYLPFVALMRSAQVILTDSGGIQEEAPGLGKPVVVMRDATERQEGLGSGLVRLTGPHREPIVEQVSALLHAAAGGATHAPSLLYGDGHASEKSLQHIADRELVR
jgi:UDP-N-acetylglucosamine 2-epimerase (non-hydrolysing)